MALISNSHICPHLVAILSWLNIARYNTWVQPKIKEVRERLANFKIHPPPTICHCFDWQAIDPEQYRLV